jgi:hypothetical protein
VQPSVCVLPLPYACTPYPDRVVLPESRLQHTPKKSDTSQLAMRFMLSHLIVIQQPQHEPFGKILQVIYG